MLQRIAQNAVLVASGTLHLLAGPLHDDNSIKFINNEMFWLLAIDPRC